MAVCPNCKGKSSAHWPFGPCTICRGTGQTTQEKRDQVLANAAKYRAESNRDSMEDA